MALPGPFPSTLSVPSVASHLPPASPHTSGLLHGAARPSGWCGQSHRTCALASPPEGRAGREGGAVGPGISQGHSLVSPEPTPSTCSCSRAPAHMLSHCSLQKFLLPPSDWMQGFLLICSTSPALNYNCGSCWVQIPALPVTSCVVLPETI